MKHNTIKYEHTQRAYWMFFLIMGLVIFAFYRYGEEAPWPALIMLFAVVSIILIHRLTIRVTDKEISAWFAFGFLRRSMKLSEIDFSSIERIKPTWFPGFGIRYTPDGWLYRVKPGKAIKIVSKDGKKVFLVGTDEYDKIRQAISDALNR